jgi:endonuclease YncB( thermonuclease family)
MGRKSRASRRKRKIGITLILILGISLMQFVTTGTVSWPGELWRGVSDNITDYATRPEAAWRQATDKLEEVGATREGEPTTTFDLTGRVVRIADGDTVSILDSANKQHKVRLFGIDTPERDQPYGKAARKALGQLVDKKNVGVVIVETDSYGRTVGTLYREGVNINVAMVAGGHAWWYEYYAPHERKLAEAEKLARKQKLGLWSLPEPIPPWDWRRRRR